MLLPSCQHWFCSSCLRSASSAAAECPQCGLPALPSDTRPDKTTAELNVAAQQLLTLITGGDVQQLLLIGLPDESSKAAHKRKRGMTSGRASRSAAQMLSVSTVRPKPQLVCKAAKIESKCSTYGMGSSTPPPYTPPVDSAVPFTSALSSKATATGHPPTPPNNKENPLGNWGNHTTNNRAAMVGSNSCKGGAGAVIPNAKSKYTQSTPNKSRAMVKSTVPPATPRLDKRNAKGETVLHVACVKGDDETVRRLLSEGANPNSQDHAGWTPLHEACQHGHLGIVSVLLKAGALASVPGWESNSTALHDAVEHGREHVIRLLRRHGARDDIRDMMGNTARDLASLCQGPQELHAALDTAPDAGLVSGTPVLAPMQHSVVITSSNLSPQHVKLLSSLAKTCRLRITSEYSPQTSHVVVGCEDDRHVCLRTAKFMMGVVAGNWILSQKWLEVCSASGSLVSPEEFEVTGSSQNATSGAPRRARLNANKMLPRLLSGCHVFMHGNFSSNCPSKRDLEGLIKAGGGKLLLREPNPESIPKGEQTVPFHVSSSSPLARCSHYIIYQEGGDSIPKMKYDMAHIKTLPLTWLIDCIDHFQLLPPFDSI
uniref:BRCA1-associated RING domain protein 1-like n=3 Tax=Hirondellea gigas TaxID=1518452 RepID=A0A6A7G1V7_9CRUS